MKKLLIMALLVLALVVTAVACDKTPETPADTTVADTEAPTEEATTEEETTEEATTEEETTEEETTEEATTEEETTEELNTYEVDLSTVTATGNWPTVDVPVPGSVFGEAHCIALHYGSVALGEMDLSKYSKVTVTYATPDDATVPGAGRRIMSAPAVAKAAISFRVMMF